MAIPMLRQGSYFPDRLLERRKRAEQALTTIVATCYLPRVSTRRMAKVVDTLGITSLSKSQAFVKIWMKRCVGKFRNMWLNS
jgi:transposase-like protein